MFALPDTRSTPLVETERQRISPNYGYGHQGLRPVDGGDRDRDHPMAAIPARESRRSRFRPLDAHHPVQLIEGSREVLATYVPATKGWAPHQGRPCRRASSPVPGSARSSTERNRLREGRGDLSRLLDSLASGPTEFAMVGKIATLGVLPVIAIGGSDFYFPKRLPGRRGRWRRIRSVIRVRSRSAGK